MHLLFNKIMNRKLAYLAAGPERGHPELQGGYKGVTRLRGGHQDPGWRMLCVFIGKVP